jgi:hypothetical protein
MNLDGQAVANKTSQGLGQPKFSREAIAEYQIVTNLYDVTQGGSTGVQLQAITKSGTNTVSGSAYGFFRDTKFNAADPVSGTVLPYKDQQFGGTLGGPIVGNFLTLSYDANGRQHDLTIQTLGQTGSIRPRSCSTLLLRVNDQMSRNDRPSVRAPIRNTPTRSIWPLRPRLFSPDASQGRSTSSAPGRR